MDTRFLLRASAVMVLSVLTTAVLGGTRSTTEFTNRNSIANTRHNLTQAPPETLGGATLNSSQMDPYRNNYGEICVYCHTPHGADTGIKAPLWNRTRSAGPYQTYDLLGTSTLTQTVTQPGANSLTCLSCHDGTVAIDSIINMPGAGRYDPNQAVAQNDGFLSTWDPGATGQHDKLSASTANGSCLACHNPGGVALAQDFSVFVIGTDLRNDHPVGIQYPTGSVDFKSTNRVPLGQLLVYDNDGDSHADPNEVRMYDTGDGYEVECASCHDPHGVPSGGAGSNFNPTFLRVSNSGSGLCLTCHAK